MTANTLKAIGTVATVGGFILTKVADKVGDRLDEIERDEWWEKKYREKKKAEELEKKES